MKTFNILLKRMFRDFIKNLKQFISIIFILATSVTLFSGLEANANSIRKRVDEVYLSSNIASLYLTINPSFLDLNENEKDYQNILSLIDNNEENVEKRMYIPSSISDKSTYSLIYNKLPNISKPYELEIDNEVYNNEDFFFIIDINLLNYFNAKDNIDYKIGDKLELNFSSSLISSLLNNNISSLDTKILNENIKKIVSSSSLAEYSFLIDLLTNNDENFIKNNFSSFLNPLIKDNITFKLKISGIMKHVENIENSTFSSSSFLLSSSLFIDNFLSYLTSSLTPSYFDDVFKDILNKKENETNKYLLEVIYNTLNENSSLYIDFFKKDLESLKEDNLKNEGKIQDIKNNLFNQILIKDENNDIETLKNNVKSYFDSKKINNLAILQGKNELQGTIAIENDIIQTKELLYVFPIIFIVVAILVVLTTISQLILKERTEIGTLKALGVKKEVIFFYYSLFFIFISFVGSILGFIIGPLLIPFIMNIKYDILYSLPPLGYVFPYLSSFLILISIFIIVTLLTFLIIRHELKLMPALSMRPKAPSFKYKNIKKEIKNISLMMALRNIRVYFTKSIMVIIGIMGCMGLLICGFGIDNVIDYGKNTDINSLFNASLTATYKTSFKFDEESELILERYKGKINDVEEYSTSLTTLISPSSSSQVSYYYVKKDSPYFKFDDGNEWDENTEIGMSEATASRLNYKIGDRVTFKINEQTYEREIGYIFYSFSLNGIVIYQEGEEKISEFTSNAFIDVNENYDKNMIKEELLNDPNLSFQSLLTTEDCIDRVSVYISSVDMMTNTVKSFAIVLAIIVLINLAILNYNERIREIATMKVLGFSRFKIAKSLIYEIMILTLIGSFFGLFLGLPLEYFTLSVNSNNIVYWHYTVYLSSYLISFFLTFLTALIVNILISLRIKKVNMTVSLKSIE